MKISLRTRRILLDESAAEHLTKMMTILSEEGGHLSLVPSRATSWIVTEFASRHFIKDKERMKGALLNRKALLRAMISNIKDGSDEEIRKLEGSLRELKTRRSLHSNIGSPREPTKQE